MSQNSSSNSPRIFDAGVALRVCGLLIVVGLVLGPMLAALFGGFKTNGELRVNPFGIPSNWDFSAYQAILSPPGDSDKPTIVQLLFNSVIVSTLTVTLSILISAMTAFVLAHIRFFGSKMLVLTYLWA